MVRSKQSHVRGLLHVMQLSLHLMWPEDVWKDYSNMAAEGK